MFSINTNNASMAALESLRMTNANLTTAQNAVSTGLSVSSASDNPAVYAIAQQMNGNIAGLSAVSSGLSFGSSVVGVASSATTSIISTLQTLQNTITAAGTTGINLSTMQSQVADALNQINTYARSSTFQGVNLLTSQTDGGSSVSSATMAIVDGLQGSTLNVANQAATTRPGSVTLTDALGLTSSMTAGGSVIASGAAGTGQVDQKILTGNSTGQNIAVGATLVAGSFSDGSNVVITNGDGTKTTFEFDASGTAPTAANTTGVGANKTVVVTVNTGTESSNQMVGDLVSAMNANGYSAAVQNDGSINVTGQGLTAFTSTVTGLPTASSGTTALSAGASAVTTIQAAIKSMTGIADALGYTTQQITGMQSFTGNLSDALTSGVGALTDADLSAESAKLTSLQTKQQLAIQSLSIANSQSQSILSLFR
jgi:flagellin